jgi:hypothetical protein
MGLNTRALIELDSAWRGAGDIIVVTNNSEGGSMEHVHRIRVPNSAKSGFRSLGFQRPLFNFLHKGGQEALRLRVENRSRAAGSMPRWLKEATEIEFLGYGDAEGELLFQAPLLGQVMDHDERVSLFEPVWQPDQTALELLEASISGALGRKPDTEWLDDGLLDTIGSELKPIFRRFGHLEWRNGKSVKVDARSLESFAALRQCTPLPQECRICGKLEAIRHSDHAFALVLENKHVIRGVAAPEISEKLKDHWGKMVIVHGEAVFRPSKSLLRVEARDLEPALASDSIWSYEPQPLFSEIEINTFTEAQGQGGVRSAFGKWPGDESEEEILKALRSLR